MKCAVDYSRRVQNADTSGRDLLFFLDAGTAKYLRDTFGYGQKVLLRFLNEAYDGMIEDMDWYSAEGENARDQMGNAYYGCINRLKYDKIYPEEWENSIIQNHTYTVHYVRGKSKRAGDNRMDFVQHAWLVAVTYYTRVIEWLHVDRHFGPARCEKAYRDLRRIYDDYIDHYLMCNVKDDLYIQGLRESARQTLAELDIEIDHKYEEE